MDRLDRQILHALLIDGRAPFSRMAEVLDTSEQTVARRYRRLHELGAVRVVVVREQAPGTTDWVVRMRCRPGAAGALSTMLAGRDDVRWVAITAGGAEVTCTVRAGRLSDDAVLLEGLPRVAQVITMSASTVLHRFVVRDPDWSDFPDPLTTAQVTELAPDARAGAARDGRTPVTADDAPLLDVLARDGRAGSAMLARATGWSPARATRRLDTLLESGSVYVDVDLAVDQLGLATKAYLWLTVAPAQIDAVGTALAQLPEVPFAAAVTGAANLVANVLCRDVRELYRLVTSRIGSIEGVRELEISPILRLSKQSGARIDNRRLSTG